MFYGGTRQGHLLSYPKMNKCIYCREDKEDTDFTLEHVIPKFLGGAYAPECFKVHEVCARCNNNLGLFVDAGFEKNWFVSNTLRLAAFALFKPNAPVGLPLICMGKSELAPPGLREEEICESWIGPLGEPVFWIRPNDERLYWYSGGNPRTAKTVESRAYFFFSERSSKQPLISWQSFRDAFAGTRVKKIMGTVVENANSTNIGFGNPDKLDMQRIEYLMGVCQATPVRHSTIPIYDQFDFRFLAKIGIGVAYALFGWSALRSEYAEELYKALTHQSGEDFALVNGSSPLTSESDPRLLEFTGEANAVTIMIAPNPEGVSLTINIGASLLWIVKCASYENLEKVTVVNTLGPGRVIVLYRQLQQAIELTLPEYISHKCGNLPNAQLNKISTMIKMNQEYFHNL